MPLTNGRALRVAAPSSQNVQNGRMVSSSDGYDLGPANARSNNMMEAYNNLRRYRQQRPPIQEQQSGYQEPAPDTRGWQEANDWEKGLNAMYQWGEKMSDLTGYGQKWEETKQKQREGNATPGDYLETFGRFIGSLPGSMIGGLAMDPAYIHEAATGRNISGMYNGLIDDDLLRADQRAASAAYVALDAASFIPGVGTAGSLARNVGRFGIRTLADNPTRGVASSLTRAERKAAADAAFDERVAFKAKENYAAKQTGNSVSLEGAEKAARDAVEKSHNRAMYSLSERAGNAAFKALDPNHKNHMILGGLAGSSVEEGTQEYLQTMMEDIRGANGDKEGGIENIDFQRDLEGAMFGAIGGGVFHGANVVASKGIELGKKEVNKRLGNLMGDGDLTAQQKLAAKAARGDIDAARTYAEASAKRSNTMQSHDATLQQQPSDVLDSQVNPVIEEAANNRILNKNRKATGFSGVLINDGTMFGNDTELSAQSFMQLVVADDNNVEDNLKGISEAALDVLFGDKRTSSSQLNKMREDAYQAAVNNDVDGFAKIANSALTLRAAVGDYAEMVFAKQPLTAEDPFRVRLVRLTTRARTINVGEEVAKAANADFDADIANAIMRSRHPQFKETKLFMDSLVRPADGKSIVSWEDCYLDLGYKDDTSADPLMSDAMLADVITSYVTFEQNNGRLSKSDNAAPALRIIINGKTFKSKVNDIYGFQYVLFEALKYIRSIEDQGARNAAFSSFLQQMDKGIVQDGGKAGDASDFLRILQPVVKQLTAIGRQGDKKKKRKRRAKSAMKKALKNRRVLQAGSGWSTNWVSQMAESDKVAVPTTMTEEEFRDRAVKGRANSNFRAQFILDMALQPYNEKSGLYGDGVRAPLDPFTLNLLAQLDLYAEGSHDTAKIMSLYRDDCFEYMYLMCPEMFNVDGDAIAFTKEFDLNVLMDRCFDGLRNITHRYNKAIEDIFYDGIHEDLINGPFYKKAPTKNNFASLMFDVFRDYKISQLAEEYIGEEEVNGEPNPVRAALQEEKVLIDVNLETFCAYYSESDLPLVFTRMFINRDGTQNESLSSLFKDMKEAAVTDQLEKNNAYKSRFGKMSSAYDGPQGEYLLTREEFKEALPKDKNGKPILSDETIDP